MCRPNGDGEIALTDAYGSSSPSSVVNVAKVTKSRERRKNQERTKNRDVAKPPRRRSATKNTAGGKNPAATKTRVAVTKPRGSHQPHTQYDKKPRCDPQNPRCTRLCLKTLTQETDLKTLTQETALWLTLHQV